MGRGKGRPARRLLLFGLLLGRRGDGLQWLSLSWVAVGPPKSSGIDLEVDIFVMNKLIDNY